MKNLTGLSLGEVVYSFISFLDFIYSLNSFDSIFGMTLKTSFMPAIRSTKLSVQESIRAIQINFSLSIVFLTNFGLISYSLTQLSPKRLGQKPEIYNTLNQLTGGFYELEFKSFLVVNALGVIIRCRSLLYANHSASPKGLSESCHLL